MVYVVSQTETTGGVAAHFATARETEMPVSLVMIHSRADS